MMSFSSFSSSTFFKEDNFAGKIGGKLLIIIIIFVSSDTASGGEESPLLYKYIRTKPYNVKPYM